MTNSGKKIIVASFQFEACSFSGIKPTVYDFEYFSGPDIFQKLAVKNFIVNNGYEVIPSIYANALPGGTLPLKVYNHFKAQILDTINAHSDAIGLFLYFHGSMEVDKIGSGELCLLKEIRSIIGKKPVISLCLDLHANIDEKLADYADIICGYKTAPHIDQDETQLRAVKALVGCLQNGVKPQSAVVPLAMLPPGDAMLTSEEPLKSLIRQTLYFESQDDIIAANLFFGHMWIDAPNTHASVVVTARTGNLAYGIAKRLALDFWNTRFDYKLKANSGSVRRCVGYALASQKKRVFISDSGDNTTAGAEGTSTDLLESLLQSGGNKKICVSGITNEKVVKYFSELNIGADSMLKIGKSKYVCKLKCEGKILGWAKQIVGNCVTLSINNIDTIFVEKRSAFICKENFELAQVDLMQYDIVTVKLGYLFDELKPYCDEHLFALSDGSSCVDIKRHKYRKLVRPMFPLDIDTQFEDGERSHCKKDNGMI